MTRFARARGSKASNERREEDATPWHVMRQQLVHQSGNENSFNSEGLSEIVNNVNSKLQESKDIWSDFGVEKQTSLKKKNIKKGKTEIDRKKLTGLLISSPSGLHINETKNRTQNNNKLHIKNLVVSEKNKADFKCKVKNKTKNTGTTKKDKLNNPSNNNWKINTNEKNAEKDYSFITSKFDHVTDSTVSDKNIPNTNNLENKSKVTEKFSKHKNLNKKTNSFLKQKHNSSYRIVANGREIQIVRYDGFLIKKDDAKKLKTLRNKLKIENVPSDKIKAILKLERRKAEKALAREKNTVCFHCRKFGHNFADCPDSKDSEESKTGICFKCGSTEHTHFQCKVSQNQNFRFAVCFICKEQGHIARQCTLNLQGQYPKGGSCHLCGEVTHLRKDCPKGVEKIPPDKKCAVVGLDSLNNRQLEDIDDVKLSTKKYEKKKNKLVTF